MGVDNLLWSVNCLNKGTNLPLSFSVSIQRILQKGLAMVVTKKKTPPMINPVVTFEVIKLL